MKVNRISSQEAVLLASADKSGSLNRETLSQLTFTIYGEWKSSPVTISPYVCPCPRGVSRAAALYTESDNCVGLCCPVPPEELSGSLTYTVFPEMPVITIQCPV